MIDRISSAFRTSLYLLLGLSTLCIGFSEGQFFPHFLTLPLIAVAYFYLDERPVLRMESLMTSILGLIALVVAILEFQQGRVNVEMRILSASHLLAYFTWIVLLIQKENQQYWWLIALSVLNMAVSASLTNSSLLGIAVILYLFIAAWTLSLFTAFRGTASLRPVEMPAGQAGQAAATAVTAQGPANAAQEKVVNPLAAVSRVRGGFHLDPADNWLSYRLIGSVLFLSFASLIVGMAIFTMTPRIWIGNWQLPSSSEDAIAGFNFGNKMSGFTTEVRLGDMGEILENPTPVLYVDFSDAATTIPLNQEQVLDRFGLNEMLFRGTALSRYYQGSWSEIDYVAGRDIPSRNAPRYDQAVRLEYELEPVGRSMLFTFQPLDYGILLNDEEVFRQLQENLLSLEVNITSPREYGGMQTLRYETISVPRNDQRNSRYSVIEIEEDDVWQKLLQTISASLEEGYQQGVEKLENEDTDLSEFYLSRRANSKSKAYDNYFRSLLEYDHQRLARLRDLSVQLCQSDDEETPLTPVERCLKILTYLKDSNEFSYTLNMSIVNSQIDPVEDFVFNRKSGHCEYFASAMALMLRTVGIPARMVSGFKGGRWDERKKQLVIEQRHAHAWVEALVDGKWLVFDPTTGNGALAEDAFAESPYSFASIRGWLNNFWQTHVIGVSLSRQRNDIYDPIRKRILAMQEWWTDFKQSFAEQNSSQPGRKWSMYDLIFYASVIVMFIIIVGAVLLYWYTRSAIYLLGWKFYSRYRSPGQQQMLLFFRRFLDISARHGLKKSPHLTAREFAELFHSRFKSQLAALSLSELPLALTNAYYQVRFRGDDLTSAELDHWKVQLDALGHALEKVR